MTLFSRVSLTKGPEYLLCYFTLVNESKEYQFLYKKRKVTAKVTVVLKKKPEIKKIVEVYNNNLVP